MKRRVYVGSVLAGVALAVACGKQPTSPSSAGGLQNLGSIGAAADGSTLKATAPAAVSPVNNQRIETSEVVLTVTNATTSFVSGIPLSYVFEVFSPAGLLVYSSQPVAGGPGTTSHAIQAPLEGDTTYTWQARAVYQGLNGPNSARASFFMAVPQGYLRGNELYDPLINGRTVGRIVGPVTFIPGVGVRLEEFHSHIVYELPQTLREGEISALVTNTPMNTKGAKTKIFSMAEGYSDVTTNEARMTVEKRGDGPTGAVAFRFITSTGPENAAETVGAERVAYAFQGQLTYLWTATWRGGLFNVRINEGGVSGPAVYEFGKSYTGFYGPSPHVVYLGIGTNRSGAENSTVPGMIVRQLWVSSRPRPSFAK